MTLRGIAWSDRGRARFAAGNPRLGRGPAARRQRPDRVRLAYTYSSDLVLVAQCNKQHARAAAIPRHPRGPLYRTAPTCLPTRTAGKSDFTEETKSILRELGYRCAVSTIPGLNRSGADLFALRRVAVGFDTVARQFQLRDGRALRDSRRSAFPGPTTMDDLRRLACDIRRRAPIFCDMIFSNIAVISSGPRLLDMGCGSGFDRDLALQNPIVKARPAILSASYPHAGEELQFITANFEEPSICQGISSDSYGFRREGARAYRQPGKMLDETAFGPSGWRRIQGLHLGRKTLVRPCVGTGANAWGSRSSC